MLKHQRGFTLIELIAILVIVGAVAVTASTRFASTDLARLQASRDDLIAALFFAQQTAVARDDICLSVSAGSVNVIEQCTGEDPKNTYSLTFEDGVSVSDANFTYDKLGRTMPATITLTAGGNSATVNVDGSGYAYY